MANKVDFVVHYYEDGETLLFTRKSFMHEVERIREELEEMNPDMGTAEMDYYDIFECYYGDVNIEENVLVQ